jgi:hypothetical protein
VVNVNMGQQLYDYALQRAQTAAKGAWTRAVADGHDMEPLAAEDWPGAFVAMCWGCRRYLALDIAEDFEAFGKVVGVRCPGREVLPAPRRNEMELEAATTSASHWDRDRDPKTIDLNDQREAWSSDKPLVRMENSRPMRRTGATS